jgi:hypothetical protein
MQGSPGMQRPGMPVMPVAVAAAGRISLGQQFGGAAAWSIGFGIISIAVPLFSTFYFPIMPIIGFINAVRAIQRGRLIGGIVGMVLNAIGGVIALIASGLILR